jgi:hypothetical protein
VEVRRDGVHILGALARPKRHAVAPGVDLAHRPDCPRLDQLDDAAVVLGGVDLRAHLGGHLALAINLLQQAGLVHGMPDRLLAVNVLAAPHGHEADRGVGVLRGPADHGLDVLLVEHLAEVMVLLCLGKRFGGVGQVAVVHVAQGDDVLAGALHHVAPAAPAHAHRGDVQLLVGRVARLGAAAGHPKADAGQRSTLDEIATIGPPVHGPAPFCDAGKT